MAWRKRRDQLERGGAHRAAAERLGVTLEHYVDTVLARRRWRAARADRRRHRVKPNVARQIAFGRNMAKFCPAGEGELDQLLRAAGMSRPDFGRLVGIHPTAFNRWCGFPMHLWPLVVLRQRAKLAAMEKWFEEKGVDQAQFEPTFLPPMPSANQRVDPTKITVTGGKAEYTPWTSKR